MSPFSIPNTSIAALSDLYWDPIAETATYTSGLDGRFECAELDCFSGEPLELDCILATGSVRDADACVETVPLRPSERLASKPVDGSLNSTTRPRSSRIDSSLRYGKQARSRRDQRLLCTYDGCNFQGSFPRPYELNRHIKATHSGDRSLTCPICSAGFVRADKLTAHIRTHHGTVRK